MALSRKDNPLFRKPPKSAQRSIFDKHDTAPKFSPSPHQQAIYDFVESCDENLAINAVAGAGKTTTLVECAKRLSKKGHNCLAIAFNKIIADELQARLGRSARASTLHSLGYSLCRRLFGGVDFNPRSDSPHAPRLRSLVEMGVVSLPEEWNLYQTSHTLLDLLNQLRSGLAIESPAHTHSGKLIPQHFIDETEEYLSEWVKEIQNLHENEEEIRIDYGDMVFAPAVTLTPELSPYSGWTILVDETQDLDPYQYQLITRLDPGRIIFVGDPNQSIYAWRGAMTGAWETCVSKFSCAELPLSVSWRCGRSIVGEAQKYVPRIESAPSAEDGLATERTLQDLREQAKPSDLIICRNNAPIIKLCVEDLLAGRPSRVIGKDIKKMLQSIAKEIVGTTLDATKKNLVMKLAAVRDKNPGSYVTDLLEAVSYIVNAIEIELDEKNLTLDGPKSILKEFALKLDYLFREPLEECITYRTIHKSKGDEAETVWWFLPQLVPSRYAKTDEQVQQEDNLAYVATTRAKENLYYVYG